MFKASGETAKHVWRGQIPTHHLSTEVLCSEDSTNMFALALLSAIDEL